MHTIVARDETSMAAAFHVHIRDGVNGDVNGTVRFGR